jgi:FAD/FMN-containing dehydrogenase/Fe-S oxidoreductase
MRAQKFPYFRITMEQLETDLRNAITGEVRFDTSSRALYAFDASNYRQVPIGVVIPRTVGDVVAAIAIARKHGAPILSRGAGTGLAGQTVNAAIVLDFSKYLNKIIEIDPVKRIARVQPGCVLDDLRSEAEKFGLTFGPDPATHKYCTFGGMIGNNSCGVHSVMAGRTVDNVHSLDVLLYDGTRLTVGENLVASAGSKDAASHAIEQQLRDLAAKYADDVHEKFPDIPRRVSGYSIDQLLPENNFHVARALVGSEGTLVTILEATVHLVPSPKSRVLLVAGYTDMPTAGDHVPMVLAHKPIGLEAMDSRLTNAMRKKHLHESGIRMLPGGDAWLLIEFGANTLDEATALATQCEAELRANSSLVDSKIFTSAAEQRGVWTVRDSALGAISRAPGEKDNWEGWEDAAVPPAKIGAYLRDFRALMDKYSYSGALYGHIGDGCLHNRIDWDPKSKEGIDKWLCFLDEASDLVLAYGGSFSGEHGDGQARGALLPKMFGPRLMQAFEDFKTIFDPDWKMNPGKLIRPNAIDANLHYGPNYHPLEIKTHFAFPDDDGKFSRAVERCVGAGVCRKEDGVMCPSYMVTREEKHLTRGRAHLLWEMLSGEVIADKTKSDEVKEALDLCLACKGCTGECPVRVDMPTYKAEFLSHYYEGKMRPRAAYAMGMIYWAARAASFAPSLVNALTHAPLFGNIAKKLASVHPKREMPRFAKRTFKQIRNEELGMRNKSSIPNSSLLIPNSKEVVLWADTFNNHFRPETALAAVRVLEDAGFRVKVHRESMCCGRPLYDWGMLDKAKTLLLDTLRILKDDIAANTPIVVLEPSCASVFRDELRKMLPDREDATALAKNTFLFSEFYAQFVIPAKAGIQAPVMGGDENLDPRLRGDDLKALLHLHCHHAVLGKTSEAAALHSCGIEADQLDSGCCGMAGAFGFEEEHYEISMQIGERKLLPAVRSASEETVIVANGFSCREQIEQATGRKTMHLAEVLAAQIKPKG